MILVDSNILIDFMQDPLRDVFRSLAREDIAVCGVVQAELLHGTRSDAEVNRVHRILNRLQYVDITRDDWEGIGFFLRILRENGLSVPLADAIISYPAIKQGAQVWTRDKHFELIQKVQPALCLFCIGEGRQ